MKPTWRDLSVALTLALLAGVASFQAQQALGPMVVEPAFDSVWFGMDTNDFFPMMTSRFAHHGDLNVHPLFSLLVYPVVKAVRVVGASPLTAVQLVLAGAAAGWSAGFFVLLRLMGCRLLDAGLFTLLGMVSTAAMFGFVLPESYPFGAVSMLLALLIVALGEHRPLRPVWYVVASAATLSITVTNWMLGLVATFSKFPWRRALQLTVNAFCLVVVLWSVEKAIFPSAGWFLGNPHKGAAVLTPRSGGPLMVTRAFLLHAMVMPATDPSIRSTTGAPRIRTQRMGAGSGTRWGPWAVGGWAGLLWIGMWALWKKAGPPVVRRVVGLTVLGQFALHLVYGAETLLYALHYLPLLVLVAAFGTLTTARRLVLAVVGMLVLLVGTNNLIQFQRVTEQAITGWVP